MAAKKTGLFFLMVTAMAGGAMLTLCGNNLDHQTLAAGVLTNTDCLECHNGSSAKEISVCLGDECLYNYQHSLLHTYPPVGRESDFAPTEEIMQAGCILENGKTTCLSCHDLTKPSPHLIREGDNLCWICHVSMRSQ